MSTRTRADWSVGGPITPAEMVDLDAKQSRLVDCVDGGTWAPQTRQTIGGLGVDFDLARIDYGGSTDFTSGTTVELAEWPTLAEGNPYRRLVDIVPISDGWLSPDDRMQLVNVNNPTGIRPIAGTINGERCHIRVPIRPRVGVLKRVDIHFRAFTETRPQQMPSARVIRVSDDGVPHPISDWVTYSGAWSTSSTMSLGMEVQDLPATQVRLVSGGETSEFVVSDSSGFTAGSFIQAGGELMQVSSVAPGKLDVLRDAGVALASGTVIETIDRDAVTELNEANYVYYVEIAVDSSDNLNAHAVDRVDGPTFTTTTASRIMEENFFRVASVADFFGVPDNVELDTESLYNSFGYVGNYVVLLSPTSASILSMGALGMEAGPCPEGTRIERVGETPFESKRMGEHPTDERQYIPLRILRVGQQNSNGLWTVTGYNTWNRVGTKPPYAVLDLSTGDWYSVTTEESSRTIAATLTNPYTASDTVITVANGKALPTKFPYEAILGDHEVITVHGVVGNAVTVKRGSAPLSSGANVYDTIRVNLPGHNENIGPFDRLPIEPCAWYTSMSVTYDVDSLR